ncbi:MAG: inositol monophosphatase [Alphaproteobacteria bacterium]|nr:inositol monophosphatase [Alphaproteobacteria bacterium]
MSDVEIEQRFLAVSGLALAAGALALGYFNDRASLKTTMKGTQDFLTVADGAVENLLRERIAAAFPGDAVLGEEGGGQAAERLWIIDPIDGTANFARGEPHWCISIGFLRHGVPEIGAIYAPVADEFYLARRGGGATRNGKPIQVSETKDMRVATVEVGWSSRRPRADYLRIVDAAMTAGANAKRSASGAMGMAYVADGRTDAYAETHINSWDVAAGVVIVREAGGWVNDFFSGNALAEGNPILACTPGLVEAMRRASGV